MPDNVGKVAMLDYGRADRSLQRWMARLPRPSICTVLLLIPAIAAALWLRADHQPWVIERTFPQIHSGELLLTNDDQYLLIGTKRSGNAGTRLGPFEIYNLATGERVSRFGESAWVNDAVFSPDGQRLVTHGGTYKTLKKHGDIHFLGEYSGSPQHINLWDTQSGALVAELDPVNHVWSDEMISPSQIYFSPDSRRLIILSRARVMLYDARAGTVISELEQPDDRHQSEYRQAIGDQAWFSPNNRLVIVKLRDPNPVRIWSAADGELISEFIPPHSDGAQIKAAFSPDSTTLAIADDSWLYLVDPATAVLRCPPVELGNIHGVWFSPDSWRVVVWHDTPTGKMLAAVDTGSGAITASVPQAGEAISSDYRWLPKLHWSPDGRQAVLMLYSDALVVRDVSAFQPIATLRSFPTRSFNFYSPDGSRAMVITHRLEILSTDDWRVTSVFPHKDRPWPILDAKFMGDTTRILTARQNGEVELWRLRRPESAWGIIALPQFWIAAVAMLGLVVSAGRDLRRWMR